MKLTLPEYLYTILTLATGTLAGEPAGKPVSERPMLAGPWLVSVEPARMSSCVRSLCDFGTRHTLSGTQSQTRGIGAARNWIADQLRSDGTQTQLEEFNVPPSVRVPTGARIVNVVHTVQGVGEAAKSRAYYVVAHYDSRNGEVLDATGEAPGANDNASGVAVAMELARIVAAKPLDSTVVFLFTSGEEQGLLGAKAHADAAAARSGLSIRAVLNNDIVGDPTERPDDASGWPEGMAVSPDLRAAARGPEARTTVRVFSEGTPRSDTAEQRAKMRQRSSEGDSLSRQIARFVAYVADREQLALRPMLVMRPDRFLRGGDHSAFNEAGFAAVRFSALNEDYSRQHANIVPREGKPYGDVASFVDETYVANVARLNLATLVHLSNAPDTPSNVKLHADQLDPNSKLSWDAPSGGGVEGYEVVWRLTTDWQWMYSVNVKERREVTLPINKDNVFFGVRSYNEKGYVSPVAVAR